MAGRESGKTSGQNEKRGALQTGVPLVENEVTSSWLIDEVERAVREANLTRAEETPHEVRQGRNKQTRRFRRAAANLALRLAHQDADIGVSCIRCAPTPLVYKEIRKQIVILILIFDFDS